MKRYFYSDPLAAAWMDKHFGMKFESQNGIAVYISMQMQRQNKGINIRAATESGIEYYGDLYIHPDSYAILEPKVEDTVEDIGIKGVWPVYGTVTNFEFPIKTKNVAIGVNSWCAPSDKAELRIIQRDNKPFHWPEEE